VVFKLSDKTKLKLQKKLYRYVSIHFPNSVTGRFGRKFAIKLLFLTRGVLSAGVYTVQIHSDVYNVQGEFKLLCVHYTGWCVCTGWTQSTRLRSRQPAGGWWTIDSVTVGGVRTSSLVSSENTSQQSAHRSSRHHGCCWLSWLYGKCTVCSGICSRVVQASWALLALVAVR